MAKPPKSYSVDSVTFYVLEVCLPLKRGKMRLYLKKQKLPKNVIVYVCVCFLPACCLSVYHVCAWSPQRPEEINLFLLLLLLLIKSS